MLMSTVGKRPFLARTALVVTAVVSVVAAWAPAARAGWSAPVTVSAPQENIDALQMASGPMGDLLVWDYFDAATPGGRHRSVGASYALAAPGGSFGAQRQLPASYASRPLVSLGGGLFAQLTFVPHGRNTSVPEVALGRVDGHFGVPQRIATSVFGETASVAGLTP